MSRGWGAGGRHLRVVRVHRPPCPGPRPSLLAVALAAALAGALTAAPASRAFPYQGPPFLQAPAPFGPDGPPPPPRYSTPAPGSAQTRTDATLRRREDRALLYGPFPTRSLVRGLSDEFVTLSSDAATRALDLARAGAAGIRLVRIPVTWAWTVMAQPPQETDLTDPASPAYHFAAVDGSVRAVAAQGLTPVLVFVGAPRFAEATPRWRYAYPGTWDPDPHALGQFAAAVARRYGGGFPDPLTPGAALPRVRFIQAWNEPNLPRYLEPQWVVSRGRWLAFGPLHYRAMLNAVYAGVKAVAHDDVVVNAGLAPIGEPAGLGAISPLPFLRKLLCLDVKQKARAADCTDPAHLDVVAFHPLSVGNPDRPASLAADVAISDAAKIDDLMRAARAARTVLPAAPKPLWVTELNWETDPPKPGAVPARLQASWVSRALHRLWIAGVRVVAWQFLVDPALSLSTPTGGLVPVDRPAGLWRRGPRGPSSDRPKPLYLGFRFPFDPLRRDRDHLLVWALLPAAGPRRAVLQRWWRGRWRRVAIVGVSRAGMVNALIRFRGASRLRLLSDAGASPPQRVSAGPRV